MDRMTRGSALTTLGGALVAATTARGFAQTAELAVGGAANDSSGPVYFAQELGFYAQAGLNVKVTILGNPGTLGAAVASGAQQIVGIPITQIATARDKGIPLVIVAPLSLYLSTAPSHALVALKDSPIRKASDCNGKTLATRDLGNIAYFGARTWLAKNGADVASVKWIELPDNQALAAMQSGRIDAASISEPALSAALQGGARTVALVQDAIAKRFLVAGCVTTSDYAKANPDVIRRFSGAILTACKWGNANQDKSAKIVEKYASAPIAPGATRSVFAETLQPGDIQPVLDAMLAAGLLKTPAKAADFLIRA